MKECSGCSACISICPKNAIKMECDEKGFLKATIDEDNCIKCGLCQRVCPQISPFSNVEDVNGNVLFKCDNTENYLKSSSGGAVSTLSNFFIENGGYVVGVKYNHDMVPQYTISNNLEEVKEFRGSKYIQAKSNNIIKDVEKMLLEHKKVLFVGLPCMISGLKNYLSLKRIDCSNLFTIDLICHGVGSPLIWDSYVKFLNKKMKAKMKNFEFRCKYIDGVIAPGNSIHHCNVFFDNNESILDNSIYSHLYQNIYFKNLIMHDCCYSCKYTKMDRSSDISVGDSIKYKPKSEEDKIFIYSSFLKINTKKGIELFDNLSSFGQFKKIDISEVYQPHLSKNIIKPQKYNLFWKFYKYGGFYIVAKVFGGMNFISYIKDKRR